MTFEGAIIVAFGSVCALSALYVALSRNLLRSTIAFFVQLASAGGVLLGLGADYLATVFFAVALLGAVLVITFASVIMGSLKESFRSEPVRPLARVFGLGLGVCLAVVVAWAFLQIPAARTAVTGSSTGGPPDLRVLGEAMLGERSLVFEILGLIILGTVVGAGMLLRGATDGD